MLSRDLSHSASRDFSICVADTPPLVEIARVLFGEYSRLPHTTGRWPTVREDIAALPQPFVAPSGALLVALESSAAAAPTANAALACGALRALDARTAEMKRLYVRPHARRRGIGEAMTRAFLDRARILGYERVRIDTAPELLAARAMYERLGFTPIPPYRDGLLPDALCFELAL